MEIKRIIFAAIFAISLGGCNYLRLYPQYSEIYIQHQEAVRIFDENSRFQKEWVLDPLKFRLMQKQKEEIENYINSSAQVPEKIKNALRSFTLMTGMNPGEVELLIGKPSIIKDRGTVKEKWIYKEKDRPLKYYWFYDWAKLHFKKGILDDIEIKHVKIYDDKAENHLYGLNGIKE